MTGQRVTRLRMKVGEQVVKVGFWLLIPGGVAKLSESLELGAREYRRIHANDNTVSVADILGGKL